MSPQLSTLVLFKALFRGSVNWYSRIFPTWCGYSPNRKRAAHFRKWTLRCITGKNQTRTTIHNLRRRSKTQSLCLGYKTLKSSMMIALYWWHFSPFRVGQKRTRDPCACLQWATIDDILKFLKFFKIFKILKRMKLETSNWNLVYRSFSRASLLFNGW